MLKPFASMTAKSLIPIPHSIRKFTELSTNTECPVHPHIVQADVPSSMQKTVGVIKL